LSKEKFLFLSNSGDGLGLALKLREAGHEVAGWIRKKMSKQNYAGIIKMVDKWENFLDANTIVMFDSTGGGKLADRLRGQGHYVFGGSAFADQIEFDRGTAFMMLEEAGVKVPESKTFFNWADGKNYARRTKERLVFKPSGSLGKDVAVGSYVSSDPEDLLEMLEYFESIATEPPEFELQRFVGDGVALSTEGWFNGDDWLWPFNHTAERKAMMNDNLGAAMGCAGNIVWGVERPNSIIDNGLGRITDVLRREGYVGPIDLNTVITANGDVWALEFTPRFGYDAMPALLQLYGGDGGDLGPLIAQLARGEKPKEMVLKGGFASALHVSVPPFPSEEFHHMGGVPIRGFTKGDLHNLYFYDVMLDSHNRLVTAPDVGAGFCITGWGTSINEALSLPYALAKKAKVPEKQYRTDLVSELSKDWELWSTTVSEHGQRRPL
jgi:phosphoribosylamine--glycine ligase